MSLLEIAMKNEEWENVSGFIKYKLFGWNPQYKIEKIIKSKKPESIGTLLKNELDELNNNLEFFRFRYDNDMKQLYREEGVNVQEWKNSTNIWHIKAVDKMKDISQTIKQIANRLGINLSRKSDPQVVDTSDYSDTESLDRIARDVYNQ